MFCRRCGSFMQDGGCCPDSSSWATDRLQELYALPVKTAENLEEINYLSGFIVRVNKAFSARYSVAGGIK